MNGWMDRGGGWVSGGERAQRLQEPKPAGSRKDRIRSLEQTAVDWAHRVSLFVPACPNLAIVVFGFGTAKHRENCIFGLQSSRFAVLPFVILTLQK